MHEKSHLAEQHQCDICNKIFGAFELLCKHREIHGAGRNQTCPLCGVKVIGLATHMKHHRERETVRCPKCYKLCNNKEDYAKHEKFHTGN